MSLFILRMIPMCSSLLRSEYLSSLWTPIRLAPPCVDLYVSRLALESTTMSLLVSLSVGGMATCCSATSCGSAGGGSDWVPAIVRLESEVFQACICVFFSRRERGFGRKMWKKRSSILAWKRWGCSRSDSLLPSDCISGAAGVAACPIFFLPTVLLRILVETRGPQCVEKPG